jgi:hypothetical protein
MKRTPIEAWQPLPEEYMHRGEHTALAVASPAAGVIGVIACDDTGMTCGFNLAPADARALAALLDLAANDAETAPAAQPGQSPAPTA